MLCVEGGFSMEKVGLNITPKEFKQLSKWSKNKMTPIEYKNFLLVS